MGWFGKLPAVGDFAGKGLPHPLNETLHGWMSNGMAAFVREFPENWQAAYHIAPLWHFLIGAGLWDKPALIGCFAPSIDKVGRHSPLIALRSFNKRQIQAVLPPQSRWQYRVDITLRRTIAERISVQELSDCLLQLTEAERGGNSTANILSDLGIGGSGEAPTVLQDHFTWAELPALFTERKRHSFWWAEAADFSEHPAKRIIHEGLPDESLFCKLMSGGLQ
jgi:type VI secretion system protein ImpM